MKVLAIGCHPDDVEFFMAGTLALLKDKGWEIAIGVVAKGDKGSMELSRRDIARVRREEAVNGAKFLEAEIHFMGQDDLNVNVDPKTRAIVTEVVRKVRPDVVVTHPPSDYMTDHEFTSRLVRDACFAASCPNFETDDDNPAQPTGGIPHLYYCTPPEGIDLLGRPVDPHFVVEVSSKLDLKRDMLACHASQRDWLKAQHGVDQYLIEMEEWGKKLGAKYGLPLAEGFCQHRGHAFPRENIIAKTLGGLAKEL